MDEPIVVSGKTPEESPLPSPELDIGNVVRLKRPYPQYGDEDERRYGWGIIVDHLTSNAWGIPMVALNIYDDDGRLLMAENHVPAVADFVASELIVWRLRDALIWDIVGDGQGHDLYPMCPGCGDKDQHPFAEDPCPQCGGWGHVREIKRLVAR